MDYSLNISVDYPIFTFKNVKYDSDNFPLSVNTTIKTKNFTTTYLIHIDIVDDSLFDVINTSKISVTLSNLSYNYDIKIKLFLYCEYEHYPFNILLGEYIDYTKIYHNSLNVIKLIKNKSAKK